MAFDKKTWMSLFIAFIMIASVIGFAFSFTQPVEKLQYKDFTFVSTPQGLQTTVNDIRLYFYYFPRDLEDVQFDEGAGVALDGARVLWVSYDPNDAYATEIAGMLFYIEEALSETDTAFVQRGLVNNSGYVLPEVSCANATASVPVIVMQSGNETKVTHRDGCVVATAASRPETAMVGDRLLYELLGVMG